MVWLAYGENDKRTEYSDINVARKYALRYLARKKGKGIVFFYRTRTAKMYFGTVMWPDWPNKSGPFWSRYYGCDPKHPEIGCSESQALQLNGKLY